MTDATEDAIARRRVIIGIAVASLVALGIWFFFFRGSDEDKIRAVVHRAVENVHIAEDDTSPLMRLGRVKGAFKECLDKDVRIHVEGVAGVPASVNGLDGVSAAVTQGLGYFETAASDTSYVDIKIGDGRVSAQVTAKATFKGTEHGGRLRVESRDVTFGVTKTDRGWRITSISVWRRTAIRDSADRAASS